MQAPIPGGFLYQFMATEFLALGHTRRTVAEP
jgi:hypothetical protein